MGKKKDPNAVYDFKMGMDYYLNPKLLDSRINCKYDKMTKIYTFVLDIDSYQREDKNNTNDKFGKLCEGEEVIVKPLTASKDLEFQNLKKEPLGKVYDCFGLGYMLENSDYCIRNAKVVKVVPWFERGVKARKSDIRVSFNVGPKIPVNLEDRIPAQKSDKKYRDFCPDPEWVYLDARFRGPLVEINRLLSYIDINIFDIKTNPIRRIEIGNGIYEVRLPFDYNDTFLKHIPDLVEKFPMLKATGRYQIRKAEEVDVWYSDSGFPFMTHGAHAGNYDSHSGYYCDWVLSNDILEDVDCRVLLIHIGDSYTIHYSYPYWNLWEASDDYKAVPEYGTDPLDGHFDWDEAYRNKDEA